MPTLSSHAYQSSSESASVDHATKTPKRMERLNLNILTVASLLFVVGGGALSFGVIYEQNRRHEETLQKLVGLMDEVRLTTAMHSRDIASLKETIAKLERQAK